MQKNKKTVILMTLFMISHSAYASQTEEHRSSFQQYDTEEYIYTKNIIQKPANEVEITVTGPIITSDNTTESNFTTAKTRTVVTRESKNGITTITTEAWTTKNPSYATKTNITLATTALITVATIASISGFSLFSIKKYITASPEDIVKSANLKWSYEDFMRQVQNNSLAGVRNFVKKNCSTAGSGFGTSEIQISKYEQVVNDLYERNKALIATHAYNPFEVARLVQENMMLETFKNNLREVEAQYKKENHDIFGTTTTASDLGKNALTTVTTAATATAAYLTVLVNKTKNRKK